MEIDHNINEPIIIIEEDSNGKKNVTKCFTSGFDEEEQIEYAGKYSLLTDENKLDARKTLLLIKDLKRELFHFKHRQKQLAQSVLQELFDDGNTVVNGKMISTSERIKKSSILEVAEKYGIGLDIVEWN